LLAGDRHPGPVLVFKPAAWEYSGTALCDVAPGAANGPDEAPARERGLWLAVGLKLFRYQAGVNWRPSPN
jgi:hypothetical protein